MLKKIEQVHKEKWALFNGPSGYEAESVPEALENLIRLNNPNNAELIGNKVLSAIANNHMGVYYPAVYKALNYIIYVAENPENKISKNCALGILNDLYYFEPDVEGYNDITKEDLKRYVKEILSPYSDENITY